MRSSTKVECFFRLLDGKTALPSLHIFGVWLMHTNPIHLIGWGFFNATVARTDVNEESDGLESKTIVPESEQVLTL